MLILPCNKQNRQKTELLSYLLNILLLLMLISTPPFLSAESSLITSFCLEDVIYRIVPENDDLKGSLSMAGRYLSKNIFEVLDSSGMFRVYSCNDISTDAAYRVLPEITEFNIRSSEKSGYFAECELFLYFKDQNRSGESTIFSIKSIGNGADIETAVISAAESISDQFEIMIIEFGGRLETYRINDIYQNTIIIKTNENYRLKKGDFLNIADYRSGKPAGTIIIEKSDSDFSYGRLLEHDSKPETGDVLKKINYKGFSTTSYINYVFDSLNTGMAAGIIQEYFKGLYVFHPAAGYEFYNVVSSGIQINLNIIFAGLSMVRHTGRLTFKSQVLAGAGYHEGSVNPGWSYNGGSVRGIAEIRAGNHLFFSASGGFTQWFSSDIKKTPDTGGFTAGAGFGIKY